MGRFGLEGDRARRIDHELQEHDVHRREYQRPAEQQWQQRHACGRHVHRDQVAHRVADIVVDAPSESHGLDDGLEVVFQKHQRRGLAGHVGAAPTHGHANVCRLERRGVVHAVAGHGDDLAVGFERVDQSQFLFRNHPREDAHRSYACAQLRSTQALELRAGQHPARGLQSDFACNRLRRARVVPGDHHHPDAGVVALLDCLRHRRPQRVRECNESEKRKRKSRRADGKLAAVKMRLRHAQHPASTRCDLRGLLQHAGLQCRVRLA